MSIREEIERMECETLSPYATLSIHSKGRDVYEEPCDIRPVFQRDRDRILHSKAFRRLKNKTQVFLTPKGDHYRTRLSHTLEVSQNARTIAKALRLNEDLVEAIALGHDIGHTPFGHAGEFVLNGALREWIPAQRTECAYRGEAGEGWKRVESHMGSAGRYFEPSVQTDAAYARGKDCALFG